MEQAKYHGSIFRFFVIIVIINTSILKANIEGGVFTSFERALKYHPLLPKVVEPFPPIEKTLILKSSHTYWNGHFLDATKRLRKIKKDEEIGAINGTVVIYHRYEKNDIQIPAIMSIDWYKNRAIKENAYNELKKAVIKKIKNKNKNTTSGGKDLTLFNKKLGETDLELSINGYITFKGNLVFESKDLVTTNSKDSKNWDLEIEQTQRFNIMGNIGDRFFIDIKQDSEADFNWENDMKIEYRGKKNEILQKAEAGNINLSLSGMDAVNMGGNNSSLFGIKAINQFGPVEIQSVIAREQVKKSEKSFSGGMESGAPISIKDYDFIIDRYFFIDDSFRNNFYPLVNNIHQINTEYVIGDYEVYQMVTTDYEGDPIYATAYINPLENMDEGVEGSWKRMEENSDYTINRLSGYIRLNNAQNAIAIAYRTTNYTNQNFGSQQNSTNTNFKSDYDMCKQNFPDSWQENCKEVISLKLIKGINRSTPIDPTWPLMFKNVYSLGGYDIDESELEVNIVLNQGAGLEETHTSGGESYLSIFNLDSEDQNHISVSGGDGKIDLYESILNYEYGELIFPMHMPFAYDPTNQWGNQHIVLNGLLPQLNDSNANFETVSGDNGPAMYYTTTTDNIIDEHKFLIKIKTSTKSATMNLDGFMIVEDSETVRMGGQILQKDIDYTIDYFSGVVNFINQDALDPAAEITISYEENQFISFDQKLLIGTYMKYGFGEKNYLAGGLFYYNQSIAEEKVDIGYEPMQNIAWNATGKYQDELSFITRAVDMIPFIETTKQSKFAIEASYAEIIPNPNPLGQAFIDDFESSKRTSSLSILQRQWKMSSPPNDETQFLIQTNRNRGKISWYNPYTDVLTESIWPEQSTSHQADNNTTKILEIQTEFNGNAGEELWNGIMIPLYSSEYNQSESKYLDVWLNANDIKDEAFELYIDIGHISEDWNDNLKLNTEDEDVYGPGMGDNILSNGEDIGVDNCTDIYEDGWGGCLCTEYSEDIYNVVLSEIEAHATQFCNTQDSTFIELFNVNSERVNLMVLDIADPNGDDWCYNTAECGTENYSKINGTEGNGQALGYHYPDTEDMNKNKTLDNRNDYFTFFIDPHQEKNDDNSIVITETINNSLKTGWKLFRIPLSSFSSIGSPEWSDVQTLRLRVQSNYQGEEQQIIKFAKIELVRNEWKEWGLSSNDDLNSIDENVEYFSVEVINTDESTEYKESIKNSNLNIIQEHDEYNNIDMKEQSLVLSYLQDVNNINSSGIGIDSIALVKNSYPALTGEKSLSYFAYEKMQMYVYGGDPECSHCNWFNTQTSDVELLFRFGKDGNDNYYEIRQPIYKGWDERNHIDINIAKLTEMKIPTLDVQFEYDVGLDGCIDDKETGFLDINNMGTCLTVNDSTFNYYCNCTLQSCDGIEPSDYINTINCLDMSLDPNQDNWSETNLNGTENNHSLDSSDEQAAYDYNEDGIYTVYANYDNSNDLYIWDIEDSNSSDINEACNYCSELRIKGSPSINNIQNIVMGVVNKSTERIYGKVLVNELRMSGVKKNKERSYSIAGSLDFADLMTISGNYQHKDAGFHKLQQRLGTGNSDDKYSTTIKFHPNIFLPHKWGVKIPITISYTNEVHTPKYDPGTDILTENIINIEELQSRTEKYSLYTSFSKSARSSNWFLKRTIDNISFTYSAIKNQKSDSQILQENSWDFKVTGNYNYNWSKENYFSPFKFTKDWLLIGNILGDTRYYYTPNKLVTKIEFNENNKIKIQRNSGTETETYNFKMNRQLILTHKFTKTFTSKYDLQINSNLDQFKDNKWAIVENMNVGRIDGITEKFTNTFKPEFMRWLNPEITFNPSYNWNLNILSDTLTADIKSSATFKTKIGLNLQDFIELVYTPDNKKRSSSRGRGRGNKNYKNNNKNNKINIQNPVARLILGKLHSLTSIVRTISSTYTYSASHNYDNVSTDINPSYLYRMGMQKSPLYNSDLFYDNFYSSESNSIIPSDGHSYNTDFKISTNINIIKSINTGLEFKNSHSLSESTTSSTTENVSTSFFPLGSRGDKGFPITNWNINWSKIEKFWFLNNIFKTISINHGFNGEKSMTYSNAELQNEQYSIHYSPVVGFTGITKGLNPITINANYNLNQTIKNIDDNTERNHNNQFTVSVKYKKTGGMKLNTFFLRDFYIKNNMDFSITFNYNMDRSLITPTRVENIADFNEHSKNKSWSISPNIGYSFTRWVTGNLYMIYGISENNSTGRTEEKDFGFNMNIKISG